jgi:ATP-dependent helicase/nuclease subunit B
VIAGPSWDALPSTLRAALVSGATVVTPNNRLARRITVLHDAAQRAAGRAVWAAPVVVPWNAWLQRLWLDVLAADDAASLPSLFSIEQGAYLWRRIVAAEALPLIDERGAAALAADAWSIVHAWGAGGPSWRAWAGDDDDCAAFARWAEEYGRVLAAAGAVGAAELPDELVRRATRIAAWRGARILLAGQIEVAPQQQRLIAALRGAGMEIALCPTVRDASTQTWRATGSTPRDEVTRALHWARDRAQADPGASIAIAIEDLATRRDEIRALADDILCPALQWPGQEEAPRPYNLSLGRPVGEVPVLAAALDLIRLRHASLPTARAAALLRSPYVSTAPNDWTRRSQIEVQWLRDGRHDISIDEAIAVLATVDREVADRWRAARGPDRRPSSTTPREWIETWRTWLAATGWPGARTLSSAEWQAQGAWDELLARFATLGAVTRRLTSRDAVAALAALANDQVFQPESPPASIEILGALEAAGLPVDALWVAGLAAEVWPPAPRPNPFLPIAWQRERNAPRATAARELAFAQALTVQWAHGAAEVVFSHAANADDHVRSVSALVPAAPSLAAVAPLPPSTAAAQFAAAPPIEPVHDDRVPPLAMGTVAKGGAALIEAQSDCPFRATARFRLFVDRWPDPVKGPSPIERGILVHAALTAFWHEVRDHATLAALDADVLARHVDAAARAAIAAIRTARWRCIAPVVEAGEATRIASVVRAWLDGFERPRPPFAIVAMEELRPLALRGLELVMRVDRIDALDDGGYAVLDYKTGSAKAPAKWFDARPQAPQIGLYVLAQRAFDPAQPVRAAAYAQLKPGELRLQGIAADGDAWPTLAAPVEVRGANLSDWPAVEDAWTRLLGALANEVLEGHAAVTPREPPTTCRNCGLQSLCRIGAPSAENRAENGDG